MDRAKIIIGKESQCYETSAETRQDHLLIHVVGKGGKK